MQCVERAIVRRQHPLLLLGLVALRTSFVAEDFRGIALIGRKFSRFRGAD